MKALYFDCSAGISGDMTVGALIDLGVPLNIISEGLSLLTLPENSYTLGAARTSRQGICATHFQVAAVVEHHHRHFSDILALIDRSSLEEPVKEKSRSVFHVLAEAEAKVHGVPLEKVHFHEVGAVDSIVDIVATAICLNFLGVENLASSPVPFGSGWIDTAHGRLPVPAPATAELMKGLQIIPDSIPGEWVTPTGAAIIAALCSHCGAMPEMKITSIGYGAGTKDCTHRPNLLRAVLGETAKESGQVLVMETHLDDITPEILGFLMDRLFEAGALDVGFSQLHMKKNRPGFRLTVITDGSLLNKLARLVLSESSATGVRYYPVERLTLERSIEQFSTSLGQVRAKRVVLPDGTCRINPEFEECRRIAVEKGVPLLNVYRLIEREIAERP